jgi:peptide/nickel transport system permease protein
MSTTTTASRALNGDVATREIKVRRTDTATHWQLMWWKFRNHKMALLGGSILTIMVILSLFSEFVGPYTPQERTAKYTQGRPMGFHVFDAENSFHLRPFVYARAAKRNKVTLRMETAVDKTKIWPIKFFVRGDKYILWGLFKSDIHLFGFENKRHFIHLLGTDQLGRDMFSRVLYATRTSLSIGAIGVGLAFLLGITLGGIAGYFGGMVDGIIMRLIEFIRSIPTLPLWMALAAALPREWTALQVYLSITAILAFIGWTHLARRVRGKLLALREEEFVLAARLSGCSHARIVLRHMLPSFMSYMIVDLTISFPYIIMAETALSFLGLGMREPIVSWGVLLYSAQNIRSMMLMPWLLIPGLVVIIAVIAFNFLGDGMRDAADPYTK